MTRPRTVFLVNLLQDVNIVRPLAYLAARETRAKVGFLVSERFRERDRKSLWWPELQALAAETNASIDLFGDEFSAYRALMGGHGVLMAASESNLSAHRQTHDVLRVAPAGYLKVTLQHGFECVGFLQSQEHDKAHGRDVCSAADVLAGWSRLDAQRSMPASQRNKYYLSGPSALAGELPGASAAEAFPEALICENLHSVRFSASGDFRDAFMDAFQGFGAAMKEADKPVALRPHPGGKRSFEFDDELSNVVVMDAPIYKLPLNRFAYGVSPPSSVLIDMLLAGIPAAVWRDPAGGMDAGNYRGLNTVSLPGDMLEFRRRSLNDPEAILDQQRRFLVRSGMLTDRADVYDRFVRLLTATGPVIRAASTAPVTRSEASRTLLVVSDAIAATQTISFARPLSIPDASGLALVMKSHDPAWRSPEAVAAMWSKIQPDILALSRYTEPASKALIAEARKSGVPVVFHIDDDLLEVPASLGSKKADRYNEPERLGALRDAMDTADVVYASTRPLAHRLRYHGITGNIVAGDIYCGVDTTEVLEARPAKAPTIGYMATGGHGADLDLALPAIVRLLHEIPNLRFETFGTIKPPSSLHGFGSRIGHHPGVRDYDRFLKTLSGLGWWVGIAPLEDSAFNRCKADTKWVEYTLAGIPVVASDLSVYHRACLGGAGFLAGDTRQWFDALRGLVREEGLRSRTLLTARARLAESYSRARLADQVLDVIRRADVIAAERSVEVAP